MKILFIGCAKIKYMPYLNFYLDQIDLEAHDVDVLYWNRDGKDEKKNPSIRYHQFNCYQEDDVAKYKKIVSFYKFRKYILKVLNENNYDFIFILHSIPGVLIYKYLLKKYKNRFIFDYRDYTYEYIKYYRSIVASLVNTAYGTFVSSDGFRVALPKNNRIYTSHNLLMDSLNNRVVPIATSEPIKIAFWGFVRHEKINKEIIRKISLDLRFELHFYGREQQIALNLKRYAVQINAANIYFHGEYTPEERYIFAKKTDIIHNIYSNDEMPHMKYAMGNKYYDGIIFYRPQLCMLDSFMGDAVKHAEIGLICNPYNDDFTDEVWAYYRTLDIPLFIKNCDSELDRVQEEYNNDIKIINKALT